MPLDGIRYYSVHDVQGIAVFLFFFGGVIFFAPEMSGYFLEYANFEEANALKTPEHIAPVWYFTPFYSVLRAVPDKFWGFVFFAASVAIPFALPWLDSPGVTAYDQPGHAGVVCGILGVLGVKAPTPEPSSRKFARSSISYSSLPCRSGRKWTRPSPFPSVSPWTAAWDCSSLGAGIGALTVIPLQVVGAESQYDCGTIPCDPIATDPADQPSLQRGAALYSNYCMGCHSLQYSRHNRVARDLGIPRTSTRRT